MFNRINENKEGFIKTLTDNIEKVLAVTATNQVVDEFDSKIEVLKDDLKGLIKIKLQVRNQIDNAVYNEEYNLNLSTLYSSIGSLWE